MIFSKDFIYGTLLYLTSTFFMIFPKVTPTVRHDGFGMKVIFIGFLKDGEEEDDAPESK
jgi:hypothetical protein